MGETAPGHQGGPGLPPTQHLLQGHTCSGSRGVNLLFLFAQTQVHYAD